MNNSLSLAIKNELSENGGDLQTQIMREARLSKKNETADHVLGGGMSVGCDNYYCVNLVPRVAQLSAQGTQEDKQGDSKRVSWMQL